MSPAHPLPTLQPLTAGERRRLLWLAREGISAALRGAAAPTLTDLTAPLIAPAAAFVSLHRAGHLRGCIGTLVADRPLYEAVGRMAVSAAFDDPRFAALTLGEMPTLAIEISRLSPLVPAPPEQVCPGRHGVCIQVGERRGVFLPQVAVQYGWDRETLLSELCLKAMLSPHAWQQPGVGLLIFEAEVFAEDGNDPQLTA